MPRLKIIALEPSDIRLLAAHLQDAVAAVSDLHFSPKERRFVLMANRFAWEGYNSNAAKAGERRRSAVRIERVERVRTQGIDRSRPNEILSLLTVEFTARDSEGPEGTLTLLFAGGAAIQLEVECVEIMLEDVGAGWAAQRTPHHPGTGSLRPGKKPRS